MAEISFFDDSLMNFVQNGAAHEVFNGLRHFVRSCDQMVPNLLCKQGLDRSTIDTAPLFSVSYVGRWIQKTSGNKTRIADLRVYSPSHIC